jgi:hypothetical protein
MEIPTFKVQKRHPNLTVAISPDLDKRLEFEHFAQKPIPLHTLEAAADYRWENEIENEIALPLDTSIAPLLKAILIQQPRAAYSS